VKLKLSIAVASYPDEGIARGIELINEADKILTKAKAAGGNRVFSVYDVSGKKSAVPEGVEPTDVRFLKEKIDKLSKSGKQSLVEFIFAFAKTIELKDHYTGEHVENTVHYSTELAHKLHLAQEDVENIREASVLHDLGKIGISDKILLKKDKLTKKEFDTIKKHPQIAADIIRPIQFMHDIIPLILYHHERWDGKGYPAGLKGEEIPIGARIISLADVYQALTSNRPYRKAFPKREAIKIIRKGAGTQFDPNIVETFIDMISKEKK
jgi:HD-GYP domain-containing protein (c-di-GMP phosphodiesterase class II)